MTFSGPGPTCMWVSVPGSPKEAQAGAVPRGRSPELRPVPQCARLSHHLCKELQVLCRPQRDQRDVSQPSAAAGEAEITKFEL